MQIWFAKTSKNIRESQYALILCQITTFNMAQSYSERDRFRFPRKERQTAGPGTYEHLHALVPLAFQNHSIQVRTFHLSHEWQLVTGFSSFFSICAIPKL